MGTYLLFNGNPANPAKRGYIPGVTPHPGLQAGQRIEVTAQTLQLLNRPAGTEEEFADFVAGVYNANYSYRKWSVLVGAGEPEPATEAGIPVGPVADGEDEHEVQSEQARPDVSPFSWPALTPEESDDEDETDEQDEGLGGEPEDDEEEIAE